jgi:phosphate:Na+ symporter
VETIGAWAGLDSPARLVAGAHTLFNVALAVVLLPVLGPAAWVFKRLVPRHRRFPPGVLEAVRADDWDDPSTALANAHREILGLGRRARRLVAGVWPAIRDGRDRRLDDLVADDDVIDLAQEFLQGYLTARDDSQLGADEGEFRRKLLYVLREWETIGDIVSKDQVMLGRKKIDDGLDFSEPMQRDLQGLYELLLRSFDETLDFFSTGNRQRAEAVLLRESVVDAAGRRVYNRQLDRLAAGTDVEAEATSVFVDLTAGIRAIHRHLVDVVRSVSRAPTASAADQPSPWPRFRRHTE